MRFQLRAVSAASFKHRRVQAGLADRKLGRVHAHGQSAGAGVEVVAGQRVLAAWIEPARGIQRQRMRGNHRALFQDGKDVGREDRSGAAAWDGECGSCNRTVKLTEHPVGVNADGHRRKSGAIRAIQLLHLLPSGRTADFACPPSIRNDFLPTCAHCVLSAPRVRAWYARRSAKRTWKRAAGWLRSLPQPASSPRSTAWAMCWAARRIRAGRC